MEFDFSKVEILTQEEIDARNEKEALVARNERKQIASQYIPKAFRDTDSKRLPHHAVVEAKAWSSTPTTCKLNLMLHGATGAGKTRLAWLALKRRYILYGTKMVGIGAETFTRRMLNDKYLMDQMIVVPLLLLDDIGKERATPTAEACLFELVRERMDRLKPTVYTTNYTDDQFTKRFTQHHTGSAITRRLNESCKIIEM